MSKSAETNKRHVSVSEVLEADELRQLLQRIVASGVLGRSKHYQSLLEFLVDCSIEGRSPKEIDLAIEGLSRDSSFDVSTDSTVRVYVHQLRKKLDRYYESHEIDSSYRIVIPKGQYRIAAESNPHKLSKSATGPGRKSRFNFNSGLLLTAIVLLLANLVVLFNSQPVENIQETLDTSQHPVWEQILLDDQPILLVMGDYYIFGELNANGNVVRMVREFNVNSPSDLEELQFSNLEQAKNYLDLDLSYMPEGSAYALTRIVPILQQSEKPINISMMSDLTSADIRSNHIVYIGYISALEKLSPMAFAGSGLRIGRSFDELFNTKSLEYYTSDAGLPEEGEPFRDYGLFSTFPASDNTQVVLIAGMRDAGLMQTAQALSNTETLKELESAIEGDTDEPLTNFEALFEVYGVDRLNFDADLVHIQRLNTERIWHGTAESGLN